MVLEILKYPNAKLKKRTACVERISKEVFKLVDDMIETMLKHDGVGLAANQVGSQLRIFVINSTPMEETPKPIVLINPEIIFQNGLIVEEEGCLSFPELYLKIPRPQEVHVHAKNLYNENIVLEATGLLARAIMHEIDHLNGILFIERVDNEMEQEQKKVKEYLINLSHSTKIQ